MAKHNKGTEVAKKRRSKVQNPTAQAVGRARFQVPMVRRCFRQRDKKINQPRREKKKRVVLLLLTIIIIISNNDSAQEKAKLRSFYQSCALKVICSKKQANLPIQRPPGGR
jgi:hypothetical protein